MEITEYHGPPSIVAEHPSHISERHRTLPRVSRALGLQNKALIAPYNTPVAVCALFCNLRGWLVVHMCDPFFVRRRDPFVLRDCGGARNLSHIGTGKCRVTMMI